MYLCSLSLSITNLLNNESIFFEICALNISQFTNLNELLSDISISLISERIWTGWGATSFPSLYKSSYPGLEIQHTHNIFLELAYNFGIPLAIIISIFIIHLTLKSFRVLSMRLNTIELINKFWIISNLIMFISHLFDITYYDGRITAISSIFLAGITCIIQEEELKNKRLEN